MTSRREEKERLRAERLAAEQSASSSARRRLLAGYVVAGLLAAAVLAGLGVVIASGGGNDAAADACDEAHIQLAGGSFTGLEPDCRAGTTPPPIQYGDLAESAGQAKCELRTSLPNEGSTHIPDSDQVDYETDPPTSGNHNPVWIADGAYRTPLSTDTSNKPNIRNAVHSMEHGRVEIHYKPSLPENQQLALKGVFDEEPDGMLLFPDPDIPYDVAVTSWTNLVACPTYNPLVLDVVRNFRDTYLGNGPEQYPINVDE